MNTSSFDILRSGFGRVSGKWRVLIALYVLNLLIVLPLVLAFRAGMKNLLGEMPGLEGMFSQFDYLIYNDVTRHFSGAVTMVSATVVPVAVISMIVHAFLGMGLARVFDADGTVREFFSAVGGFAGRAATLLLIFLVGGGLFLVVLGAVLAMVFGSMTSGLATEDTYFTAIVLFAVFMGIALAIVSLGAEYARIFTVRENSTSMLRNAWRGVVFVIMHPFRMLFVHGFLLLSFLLAVGLYWFLEGQVGMTSTVGVLVMLFIQQVFVLYRLYVRMWNTAGAVMVSSVVEKLARVGKPRNEPPGQTTDTSAQPRGGSRPYGQQQDGQFRRRRRRRPAGQTEPRTGKPQSPRPEGSAPRSGPPPGPASPAPGGEPGSQAPRPRRRRRPRRRPPQKPPQP